VHSAIRGHRMPGPTHHPLALQLHPSMPAKSRRCWCPQAPGGASSAAGRLSRPANSSIRHSQSCLYTAARQQRDLRSTGLGRHPGARSTYGWEGSKMTTQELTVWTTGSKLVKG
ncbi:Protein Translation Initiation Factor 4A, partial [Giardia duodenalis]